MWPKLTCKEAEMPDSPSNFTEDAVMAGVTYALECHGVEIVPLRMRRIAEAYRAVLSSHARVDTEIVRARILRNFNVPAEQHPVYRDSLTAVFKARAEADRIAISNKKRVRTETGQLALAI